MVRVKSCVLMRMPLLAVYMTLLLLLLAPLQQHQQQQQGSGGGGVAEAACPPANFDAVPDFQLDNYLKRWYVQSQKVLSFQPESQLYCVFAEYSETFTNTITWCRLVGCAEPLTFYVFNSAKVSSTNGLQNTIEFVATVPDPDDDPAKAYVGLLPAAAAGALVRDKTNYWVVDVGSYADLGDLDNFIMPIDPGDEDDDRDNAEEPADAGGAEDILNLYQWAIVTAGEPLQEGEADGLCIPEFGFWFLTADPSPPDGVYAALEARAVGLGLDTSVLRFVQQDGCTYSRGTFWTNLVGNVVGALDAAWAGINDIFT